MDAATLACAPPDLSWDGIHWSEVIHQVRRLQARIVKATQAGNHGKAKSLQWLLTHSFSGKALAVKRVTSNNGRNTPGVDKIIWKTPTAKIKAIKSLERRSYSPLPLRRVLIPKKNGKTRPLGIPAMKCRAMQALYLLALEPIAETTADLNSYGFRPERATADAGEQCFNVLSKKNSAQWILEADVNGCFDNISHSWMLDNIPMDKGILRKWLKAGYIYQHELFPTDAGTPQGGIISPVLANMVLDGIESMLTECFPMATKNGLKMNMVRYADDIVITGYSKEWLESEVKPALSAFLATRGLTLSPEKTKVTHIADGFDFLGWNIRKYNGKLLIKPSKANTKALLDKVRVIVKTNKAAKPMYLIKLLNPVLRGWANYHRHAVAKKVFNCADSNIWSLLWNWAKRRHPNKRIHWIKEKYFKSIDARNWVFSAAETQPDGIISEYTLLNIANTPIQRHVKIKSDANPYDPAWEPYLGLRWGKKMAQSPRGRARLFRIWKRQDGVCLTCNQPITDQCSWELRRVIKWADGGSDAAGNFRMHHRHCKTVVSQDAIG